MLHVAVHAVECFADAVVYLGGVEVEVQFGVKPNAKVFEWLLFVFEFEVVWTGLQISYVFGDDSGEIEVEFEAWFKFVVSMEDFVECFVVIDVQSVVIGVPLQKVYCHLQCALLQVIVFTGVSCVKVVDRDIVTEYNDLDAFDGVDGASIVEVDSVEDGAESAALWAAANVGLPC